jgi:hypothetical protein
MCLQVSGHCASFLEHFSVQVHCKPTRESQVDRSTAIAFDTASLFVAVCLLSYYMCFPTLKKEKPQVQNLRTLDSSGNFTV